MSGKKRDSRAAREPRYVVDEVPAELSAARLWVAHPHRRPYFGVAVTKLVPVISEAVPRIAVDANWRMYVNPKFMRSVSVRKLGSVLLHELGHLLGDHPERCKRGNYEHQLFNVSGDLEINGPLDEQEDVDLPKGSLLAQDFDLPLHLSAEEYYALLKQDSERSEQALAAMHHSCGSCAHGRREPFELPAPGEGPPETTESDVGNTLTSVRGVTAEEAEIIRRKVAEDMLDFERSRAGTLPAGYRRWASELLTPKVPWRQRLLGRCSTVFTMVRDGMMDYTYSRPNRRQEAVPDFILPSLVEHIPNVAIVIDTSGSMSEQRLTVAMTEVKGIIMALSGLATVQVLSVDAAAHSAQAVFRAEQVQLFGGGGTDMGAGIEAACALRPRPDIIIVITDGETPWPDKAPQGVQVVVVIIDKDAPSAPAWAHAIVIDD